MASRTVSLEITGGRQLEAHLRGIAQKLARGKSVSVGFFANATYGSKSASPGKKVAEVAALNEFGTSRAPARPFFRTMIAEKSPRWGARLGKLAVHYKYDSELILRGMGESIQGDLVESINEWKEPPNAPSTAAKKGFNKPLIDKGHMRNSAAYEVNSDA